ncbi:MAG TPA: FHA domain-containing protein [Phycisphaerae bacterium]|nr:FHA domain-containing protein [Phycisphaerae bacterium]
MKLVLVMPGGQQRKFAVKKEKLIIGRGTDCSLQIPAATVSRHHCELALGESQLSIRDLNSSNGTYVNKERIIAETPLSAGDTLTVGPVVFTVVINGEPATISVKKPAKPKPRPQAAAEDSGSIDLDELEAVDDLEEVADLQEHKAEDPVAALSALTRPKKVNLPSPKPSS